MSKFESYDSYAETHRVDLKRQHKEKQMGRPLNKKYFGQTNIDATGEGVGGEGVATVTIAAPIAASMNTGATAVFSAPQIPGGETATGTVTIDGAGDIAAIIITNAGSGYTSVPTITVTDTPAGGGESTTLTSGAGGVTIALTSGASARQNSITITAYIPASGAAGYISGTGGSSAVTGDIVRQVGSNKYVVETAQGIGRVTLVTAAPGEGEARIAATDSAGETYWVTKLTAHRARLTQNSGGVGSLYATGDTAPWDFAPASGSVVQIANR